MNNGFEPVGTHQARSAERVRIYSSPMFVRPRRTIKELVAVRYDAQTQTFRVSLDDKWAELRPRVAIAIDSVHAVRKGRHFGLLLDAEKVPATLEWELAFGPGVKETADGVELAEYDGVKLGLFLTDWKERFGNGFHQDGSRIMLETSYARRRKLRDGKIILDLDPTTVDVSAWKSYGVYSEDPDPWDVARDSPTGSVGTSPELYADSNGSSFAYIQRVALQFDTLAYPTVSFAKFWWYFDGSSVSEVDYAGIGRVSMGGYTLTDAETYALIKAGYEGAFAEYFHMTDPVDPTVSQWAWVDVLGIYQGASSFTLGAANKFDIINDWDTEHVQYVFDSGYTPYLEITPTPVRQAAHTYRRRRT
jgi:hypothetical protein